MRNIPFIKGGNFVTVMVDGETHTIYDYHDNYTALVEALRNNDLDGVRRNLTVLHTVQSFVQSQGDSDFDIYGETLYYKGEAVHNSIADRIVAMAAEGFDVKPLQNFMRNLFNNPSMTAVNELYDFLETGKMPITEDGCFLAYKKVRGDYTDIYSGQFDNSIGSVAEMPRNKVDDNRDNTCSQGLHFCSLGYLPYFGAGPGNKVVIVKVNPADVVSIPSDYSFTKGRTWRYEVVDEHTGSTNEEWFDKSVYSVGDFGDDFDDSDDEVNDNCSCDYFLDQDELIVDHPSFGGRTLRIPISEDSLAKISLDPDLGCVMYKGERCIHANRLAHAMANTMNGYVDEALRDMAECILEEIDDEF